MTNEVGTGARVLAAGAATAALAACSPDRSGLGVAVVGLGGLTIGQVLPALRDTANCHLAALVSGSGGKMREEARRFGVPEDSLYSYDDFDRIASNDRVAIVYIAVPNALHSDFAIRAARAGKHVLCEKPLATSVEQAEAMVAAARDANRFLAVAYRTHHSPHHRELVRLARAQTFGRLKCVRASIGFGIDDDWRLDRSLAGGGVLLEQGVYAVNAARSLIGENPIEVFGHQITSNPGRFAEVEESVVWTMRFAKGEIAQCAASYTMPMNKLWVGASEGVFELDPAYTYGKLRGSSTAGAIEAPAVNQFAAQFDDFAARILAGTAPEQNSGEEGLMDVRFMDAIYRSIAARRPIAIA